MHRKIFAVFLSFVLLILPFSAVAYAADTAVVYGDAVATQPNSIFFVPVHIKNNPGIMGFKITVTYDPEILTLPALTGGTVTEKGMLNDSIGASKAGIIDIVWTSDSAIASDGTLFTLSFNVDETEAKSTKLTLSYSQPDTFNEQYEDVIFDCTEVAISFTDEEASNSYSGEIKEPDYKDVIVAVDSALKEMPFDSINNFDHDFDSEFLESVNETINIITGTQGYFGSVDEIIEAYKAATATDFVNTSVDAVDPGVIDSIIDNALSGVGAEALDAIPSEKKAEFVAAVESGLREQASDIDIVSDTLTEDEAIDAVISLQSLNAENQRLGTKVASAVRKTENLFIKIMVAVVITGIAVFAALALIIKKKQKKTKEEK